MNPALSKSALVAGWLEFVSTESYRYGWAYCFLKHEAKGASLPHLRLDWQYATFWGC